MPVKKEGLSLFAQAVAVLQERDFRRAYQLDAAGKKPLAASARDLVTAAEKRLRKQAKRRAQNDRGEG
jgi:hypothetical protein